MPLSVNQVLNPPDVDANLRFLLDTLESIGFVTTSWHEGSIPRNILTAVATSITSVSNLISNFTQRVISDPGNDAWGTEWLDFIVPWKFGISRSPAVKTKRLVTFTSAGSAPNHNIVPGSLVAANGVRFSTTNTSNVFLGTGLTVDIEVEAEFAGIEGNIPSSTALTLQTAYTGATVAFNGLPTTPGAPLESNNRFWTRAQLAPAAFTYSSGLRAYEFWALTASPTTERVKAWNNYPNENDVHVSLYPGTPAEVALAEAYIADFNPPNDVVTVEAATIYNQAVIGSPRVARGTLTTTLEAAIQAEFDILPIGGIVPPGSVVGKLLPETITKVLLCSNGATAAGLVTPDAPVILGATDVVIGVFTLTPEYY